MDRCTRRSSLRTPIHQLTRACARRVLQGMTISRLHVFLGGVFDYGQAYVALSRATSLECQCGLPCRFRRARVSHPRPGDLVHVYQCSRLTVSIPRK